MALCHNCDDTRIKYIGNGYQTDYTFPFEYYEKHDVAVANWNEELRVWETLPADGNWEFLNDTTLRFNVAPEAGQQFIIYRCTDLTPLPAEFYPGTSIKANDLNDNFFVLKSAIEETRCSIDRLDEKVEDKFWDKVDDTIYVEDQINDPSELVDDEHIFSAEAIAQRSDIYHQDPKPVDLPYEQPGKEWYDTATLETYIWDSNAGAWVDMGNAGPQGPRGDFGPPGKLLISDEPPTEYPAVDTNEARPLESGDMWWDSQRVLLYVYYTDSDSSQWVAVSKTGPEGPPGQDGQQGPEGGLSTTFEAPLEINNNIVSINLQTLNGTP